MKAFFISILLVGSIGWTQYIVPPLGEYPYINCQNRMRDFHVQVLKQASSKQTKLAVFSETLSFAAPTYIQELILEGGDEFYSAKSDEALISLRVFLNGPSGIRSNALLIMLRGDYYLETELNCSIVNY